MENNLPAFKKMLFSDPHWLAPEAEAKTQQSTILKQQNGSEDDGRCVRVGAFAVVVVAVAARGGGGGGGGSGGEEEVVVLGAMMAELSEADPPAGGDNGGMHRPLR